jgi:hypothetical protein
MQSAGIEVYTIEMAFSDAATDRITNNHTIRIRGSSVLWQKERLLNHLVKNLPGDIDKVAWIDADVLFDSNDWPQRASRLLDYLPIIQLFEKAQLLGPSDEVQHVRQGIGWAISHGLPDMTKLSRFHPGLAWAARRSIVEAHGFYDSLIVGGADSAMVCAMAGWFEHDFFRRLRSPLIEHCLDWARKFHSSVLGRVGYLPITVRHLWHGELSRRQYVSRFGILGRHGFDPTSDIRMADNGTWEWASPKPDFHDDVLNYFRSRDDK